MARKGRPRKSRDQKLKDALERTMPNEVILQRRRLFSFVTPPTDKRLDGRNGEIDSEVCDGIGMLCALGKLDGHGHDPVEMRDKGRFWGGMYVQNMKRLGPKVASYERRSRTTGQSTRYSKEELQFEKMDKYLPTYERSVLLSLLVDPLLGHDEITPWAKSIIDEALLERGRLPFGVTMFPTEYERGLLLAAVRGLCVLLDGALPARFERAA